MPPTQNNPAIQLNPITVSQDTPTFDPESEQIVTVLENLNQLGRGQVALSFSPDQALEEQFCYATNFFGQLNDLTFQTIGRGLVAGPMTHVLGEQKHLILIPLTTVDYNPAQKDWGSFTE